MESIEALGKAIADGCETIAALQQENAKLRMVIHDILDVWFEPESGFMSYELDVRARARAAISTKS